MRKHRDQLLRDYGYMYERDYTLNQNICRYCNAPFYCYDHRPPISLCPSLNLKKYIEDGRLFKLLPSCKQCNAYLSNYNFMDELECLFYLIDKYRKSIFRVPIWTQAEIDELDHSLKGKIILDQNNRNDIVDKIDAIRINISTFNYVK